MPSPSWMTVPTSSTSAVCSKPMIWSRRMDAICRDGASRLSSGWKLAGLQGQPQALQPATHGGVDEEVADSEHDAADDRRVDRTTDGDRLAGGRLEPLPQALGLGVVDGYGRGQGHRE